MNDELQKALTEILSLLTESAKAVGTAAQAEVPVLVREYLAWGFWSSVTVAAISILALVGVWKLLHVLYRVTADGWDCGAEGACVGRLLGTGVGLIVAAVAILNAIDSIYVAVKVTVAPRVYLLDTVIEALR